jgi:hypothetical protein
MSISEYYQNRIASSEAYLKEKKDENIQYANQEEQERGLMRQQIKKMNALKTRVRIIQNNLENFVRDHGGVFCMTDEQEREYSKMMDERSVLRTNLKETTALRYNTAHKITSWSNKYYSNCMSIFNETLEIGELKNQQHLFSALTSDLG